MGGMQELLLEQFIEKDHGDDLLLLTATEPGGHVVGLIFWRYLHSAHDDFWHHVMVDPSVTEDTLQIRPTLPPPNAWVLIELLCTDDKFRGRGVGKLLLVAALAYSAVKDGKTAAVLILGRGDENLAAAELYRRLGFQRMPEELFCGTEDGHAMVDPRHVLVLWNIRQGLRSLTLQEVSGVAKGTVVPQLEDDNKELLRLDSGHCAEVVERLTSEQKWVRQKCGMM
eukprot:symbB.v1.2.027868.t1/scaffold2894.1/size68075/5